jgi:predicted esterase
MRPLTGGSGPHEGQPVATAGAKLAEAHAAIVLLHGRGGDAASMLGFSDVIAGPRFAAFAPQAAEHTWYPLRFIEPPFRNEPYLSSALSVVRDLVDQLLAAGMPGERIVLAGFSQGACLALEAASRHTGPLGGALGFSGGLIGDDVSSAVRPQHPGLPVLLGCAERDPHIPAARVLETARVFEGLGAKVETRLYPGASHEIVADEIARAKRLLAAI